MTYKFKISKMDCPCEERLIRMKLEGMEGLGAMQFDIAKREADIEYAGDKEALVEALESLNLGSSLIGESNQTVAPDKGEDGKQRKALIAVLAVNFAFFLIEALTGWIADSMGLVADSLDMLADALVYGMSLYAVGAAIKRKKDVARISGYLQLFLGILGMIEVIKRFIGVEETPDYTLMVGISILAMIANSYCIVVLNKLKSDEAHIQASVIFSATDVLINFGIIVAGGLTWWTNSKYPDLIVGSIVFALVLYGSFKILRLAKK